MAKIKLGKWEVEEEELLREIEEATRRGEEAMKTEIQASSVRYDQSSNKLFLELKNGATFVAPCGLIQGLRGAAPELIAKARLGPRGASLHWAKLDVDFSVGGLLEGRFGTKKWMEQLPQLLAEKKRSSKPSTKRSAKTAPRAAATNGGNNRRRSRQLA